MGKSYKRHPVCTGGIGVNAGRRRFVKRTSSRLARRQPIEADIPDGKAYRRMFCTDRFALWKERQPWEREALWMVEGGYEDESASVRRMWERLYYAK